MRNPTTGPCRKCGATDRNAQGNCRPCAKAWRTAHKDTLRSYSKKYYAADRGAQQQKQRKYYEDNREAVRARAAAAYDPEKARAYSLRRLYNLSSEERASMELRQNGVCAICRQPELSKHKNGSPMPLSVDHDHHTGKVRGLLCSLCNKGLGLFLDNLFLLHAAADYLEHHHAETRTK